MAHDRFIYWTDQRPTREEVEQVLRDYLGGVGELRWNNDDQNRFYVELPGTPTHPLATIDSKTEIYGHLDRWIEVCVADDEPMDIITRQMDPFTNAIAADLAQIFASRWLGRIVV